MEPFPGFNHFYENGYQNTSVPMIADELGLVHSNIFYHFKNKEEILREVFLEFFQNIEKDVKELGEELSSAQRLLSYSYLTRFAMHQDEKMKRLYFEATDVIIDIDTKVYPMSSSFKAQLASASLSGHFLMSLMMPLKSRR
ncbi:MAG TPA: hypothetical protein DHN33_10225 [Eubacteriaceae bacterium]|nr:hypothetical protein [Eubacteriaceae bacterium]